MQKELHAGLPTWPWGSRTVEMLSNTTAFLGEAEWGKCPFSLNDHNLKHLGIYSSVDCESSHGIN